MQHSTGLCSHRSNTVVPNFPISPRLPTPHFHLKSHPSAPRPNVESRHPRDYILTPSCRRPYHCAQMSSPRQCVIDPFIFHKRNPQRNMTDEAKEGRAVEGTWDSENRRERQRKKEKSVLSHLLPTENQALLHGRNSFFLLYTFLYAGDL